MLQRPESLSLGANCVDWTQPIGSACEQAACSRRTSHDNTFRAMSHLLRGFLSPPLVQSLQVRAQLGLPSDIECDPGAGSTGIAAPKKAAAPTVPADVKLAVARFKPYFDLALFPKVGSCSALRP